MPRCRMRHWVIALILPFIAACGSEGPSPASPTTLTDSQAQVTPSDPAPIDRELPPGPPIGTILQPKDIIVMVDRDETDPNAQNEELGLAKTFGLSKVADTLLDDYDTGSFTRYGPSYCGPPVNGPCWKEFSSGYNGHMWWTYNNKYTTSNYAIWQPYLQCAGVYSVLTHIPNNNATTTKAPYTISHAYGNTPYNINQNNFYNQWVGMGSYTFNKSGSSVKLIDATGETLATKKIGFDAMKWTWVNGINTLTINYPNGGETWYKSGCLGVSWASSLTDNVRIHLYRYGSIYKGLTNSTPNDGYECIPASYFSDVPSGGGYDIRMSNVNSYCDGTTYDQSNGTFSIYSPSVTVNSPNGGESYMGTGTMGINWSSAGLSGNIRIQLCQNGSCNITIHDGASNTGSYTWNILNISGSGYKIRLTSVNDGSIWDESNSNFTITAPPPPVVTISTNSGYDFTTTASSVQIAGTCTDGNNDIDWIRYNNSATGWNTTDYGPSGGSFNFSQTISLTSGSNPIQVTCQDLTGAVSSDSITVTYTPVGAISGTVTNSSGSALNNAIVTATGPMTATASTNASGQYSMGGLPIGTYSVKANMSGHIDQTKTVSVSAGNTTAVDFSLTKVPKSILSYSPLSISTAINSGTMDGSKSFVVKNAGDAAMNYTLSVNVPWISLQRNGAMATGSSFGLAAGVQDTVFVIFNSNGMTSTPSPQGVITITATHSDLSQETKTIAAEMTINPPAPQPPAPAEQPAPATPPLQPAQYGPCQTQTRCYADPVNTAIGNYLYESTDLAIEARGPDLIFARYYNSLDTTVGPLGQGWSHSLNIYLILSGNGDVYVRWGDGKTDWYVYNSSTGGYTPPAGVYDQLVKGSVYTLTDKDQNVWVFSAEGQLQNVTDLHNNKLMLSYDTQSKRLTGASNAVGDTFTIAYISSTDSKLASVTDFTGRKVQFEYTGNLLTKATDVMGKSFGFEYDAGRLSKITERDVKILVSNTYDSSGRVTDQYDGLNNHTTFSYNTPSAGQTTVTDPANNKHIYSYDSLYRLTSQKAPTGDTVSFLYNTQNLPVEVTDTNGKKSLSTYDNRGDLTSYTDASGAKWLWTYDTLDRVTSHTTPLGLTTIYNYDTNSNLEQTDATIDGILHSVHYGYLVTGELSNIIDPLGFTTTYNYNNKGELTSLANANLETTNFGYDPLHRQTSVIDPLTRKWEYKYNAADLLTDEISPLLKTSTYNYNERWQLTTEAHPEGSITHNYDEAGRLKSVTTPAGTTNIGYNTLNQRTSETDPAQKTTNYKYNTLGYLDDITDPTGRTASFTYNAMGHLLSSTNSAGQKTTYLPNAVGRPATITDPLNHVITINYTADGQVSDTKDPALYNFHTDYDNAGRKTQAVNPLSGATIQKYDKNSRITQLTTPAGTIVKWTHDKVGRILSQESPSGTKRSFNYDVAGQLKTITNANTQKTEMEYDVDGKLTKTTFADGVARSVDYDPSNRPTQIAAAGKTRGYTYDSANRIASSTDSWNKTISYTYNTAGALESITYPGNKIVSYGYDAAGRMTSVTDWLGGITSYNYDPAGRLQLTSYPNGVTTTRSYDGGSRISSITHKKSDGTILFKQAITYNSRGYIESIDVTPEPAGWTKAAETNYTTNTEDQYTQAGSELLGYDPVGQILTRNLDGAATSYGFDARERLASVTSGGATTAFTYGPEGERIEKITGAQTTRYVVDTNAGLPRVLLELDASSVPATYYIYGMGLVARTPATGSAIQYYHEDMQSNIALLTDTSAAVTDTYVYHPFGKVLGKTGTTANPYQFAGHLGVETDGTLLYMRARYYDPTLGRFISKDPLGIAAGDVNLYAYVHNNPTGYTDSSGLFLDILADLAFIAYDVYSFVKEPSWTNGIALGLDVGAAFVPFVTGAGSVYKIAKATAKVEKVRDAGKPIEKTYQTYIKKNLDTGEVYAGRTSGRGTPLENVQARDRNHHKTKDGFGPAEIQATFDTKDAVRGHEQVLYNKYKKKGIGTDQNLPISNDNPNRKKYLKAAKNELHPNSIPSGLGATYNACSQFIPGCDISSNYFSPQQNSAPGSNK